MRELSYVSPSDPAWKRWLIASIEDISGRKKYLPLYERWKNEIVGHSPQMMTDMLELINVRLDIHSRIWPPPVARGEPLVMIANHPYGIGDGISALAMAEQLNRPYRVLINKDLLKVPEITPYSLPINFSETQDALEMNLKSRAEARRLLKEGVTIVVFPAGGVATAANPFGRAEELPWKTFAASLIQQAKASVLPIFFEGQNSILFHLVSRLSLTLRLSLLVSEFRHFPDNTMIAHVGEITPFSALENQTDRKALIDELYILVQQLAPHAQTLSTEDLMPTPLEDRPSYPW